MPSKSKVCFFFEYTKFSLKSRKELKDFIEFIFKQEGKKLDSINYVFCSDNRLLKINQEFLHHDEYTDIISFDLSESSSISAEIYISIERVRNNSDILKTPFTSELHRVIFHGALHLCGYSDKTEAQRTKMRKKEDFYLSLYFT